MLAVGRYECAQGEKCADRVARHARGIERRTEEHRVYERVSRATQDYRHRQRLTAMGPKNVAGYGGLGVDTNKERVRPRGCQRAGKPRVQAPRACSPLWHIKRLSVGGASFALFRVEFREVLEDYALGA